MYIVHQGDTDMAKDKRIENTLWKKPVMKNTKQKLVIDNWM